MNFQREMLVSFEKIYGNLKAEQGEIKEFLLTCVLAVLQNYANKLKSGWKIVLSLINFSLSEQSAALNLMANRVFS